MTSGRYHNELPASPDEIAALIAAGHQPVIQFDSAPTRAMLEQVNELCRLFGPAIEIRFFAFQWKAFDTSVLDALPDVVTLSIDTIRSITDFGPIARLEKLTRLRFGVFEHPDGSFLKTLDLPRFTHLGLIGNKRRNYDLAPLADAAALTHLFVQGHDRGIEAIARLPHLADVSLSGFPKRHDLAFLNELPVLQSLFLILGSRQSIAEFDNAGIRKLRIVWVKLLEQLGPLTRFKQLETLEIEDQLHLKRLDLTGLSLKRLLVSNCKNLVAIDGLDAQPDLDDFATYRTPVALS